jgi:hypothetical protein
VKSASARFPTVPYDSPMADDGFPDFRHGQFTVEGEIERAGAFARGANRSPRTQRRVRVALFVIFGGPILVALLATLVQALL